GLVRSDRACCFDSALAGSGGAVLGDAVGSLGDAELNRASLAVADDLELDGFADLGVSREPLQLTVVFDRNALERQDHVVLLDADVGPPGRADDADRDGLVEPERIADRDRPFTDP